ncbi:MAG TPA: molybdenum cofactor biosynthesis protein MoaE [Chitinophagaceae bacterium]|nr:molybdenum cofactor biosynthesis protein MoaE [Chitinophagaceae bacterium]
MAKKNRNDLFMPGAITPGFIAEILHQHRGRTEIGAHSIFLGQTRADDLGGKKVCAIEFTSYEAMALEAMQEIREKIFEKYALTCMHVHHSLGKVEVGGVCLFVLTSSPHRKAAMEACSETVERVKAELPIWGKELLDDDSHQWKAANRSAGMQDQA